MDPNEQFFWERVISALVVLTAVTLWYWWVGL
jgi:hypothetical protein